MPTGFCAVHGGQGHRPGPAHAECWCWQRWPGPEGLLAPEQPPGGSVHPLPPSPWVCILLSKFDFAHNLDRHLSPAAGTGQSLTATVPPWTAALVPSGVVVAAAAALLNSGQPGGGRGQGGGPRWGRHSHSQQLRSPGAASAAAASAAACLSPRSSPCGFPYQHPHSCQPLRVSLRASE